MKFAMFSFSFFAAALAFAEPGDSFKDSFTDPKLPQRRAMRGEWKFVEGVAICKQDDELYKKFKDHGPILFYDMPLQDAVIRFSYKADGCKTVSFTANGQKGHVFRINCSENGASIRAFTAEKPIQVGEGPALKQGEWTDVVVELKGTKATIRIGKDYENTVDHPTYGTAKSNISLGFSFGTLSVKGVSVEKR